MSEITVKKLIEELCKNYKTTDTVISYKIKIKREKSTSTIEYKRRNIDFIPETEEADKEVDQFFSKVPKILWNQ